MENRSGKLFIVYSFLFFPFEFFFFATCIYYTSFKQFFKKEKVCFLFLSLEAKLLKRQEPMLGLVSYAGSYPSAQPPALHQGWLTALLPWGLQEPTGVLAALAACTSTEVSS